VAGDERDMVGAGLGSIQAESVNGLKTKFVHLGLLYVFH
jgi:hypothetical protein